MSIRKIIEGVANKELKEDEESKVIKAQDLIRYTYNKMSEKDPVSFVNFVLGGMDYTEYKKEADIIVRDLEEGAPWIRDDEQFNSLVRDYQKE